MSAKARERVDSPENKPLDHCIKTLSLHMKWRVGGGGGGGVF